MRIIAPSGHFRAALLCLALGLTGCPDIPVTPLPDGTLIDPDTVDGGDGEVFVPLRLDRIIASQGSAEGSERVSIYGEGFSQGAKVTFGDSPGGAVLVLEPTRLNVNVPTGAPGLVDVTVELLDGQVATLDDAYLYRSPMTLTAITPTEGPVKGGIPVEITGEELEETTLILVGGRALEDPVLVDRHTIQGTLPAHVASEAGWVDVVASNGFEQRVLARAFRYVDDLGVDWLSPATGPHEGGTLVTLHGRGLDPGTVVSVGGTVAEVVTEGVGHYMTIRTPPGEHGPADLTIVSSQASLELDGAFMYTDLDEMPPGLWLGNAWPAQAPVTGGVQVALSVYGFDTIDVLEGLTVTFGGQEATVLESIPAEAIIVVAVPPGELGPATIAVNTVDETALRLDLFTYVAELRVDGISPASGPPAGGTVVTLEGTGFTDQTIVRFGGHLATAHTLVDESTLKVTSPASVPGRVDLRVVDGSREVFLPAAFNYASGGAPALWAVTPPDGCQSGGRLIRVHGQGFTGSDPTVTFGGVAAEEVAVIDDGTIHARAPRGEVGSVNVKTSFGTLAMAYTYFDPTASYGGTHGGPIPEALNVTVLEMATREPVDQAFVILWDDLGTPYQGLTDDRGQITFSDVGFGPTQMVTAGKDMYTTASVVDFDARNVTLFIFHMEPSQPGGGGGGGGGEPLPDSQLAGQVSGLDKKVFPPPGDCANKEVTEEGGLCAPCETDADCVGESSSCTDLGEQGSHCTYDCATDGDCPEGYMCLGVGFGAVECVPQTGSRAAWCGTTVSDAFELLPEQVWEPAGFADSDLVYFLDTGPGEKTIYCFGGYVDYDTKAFIPQAMGVRRHVFVMPGEVIGQQDVFLDIPLTRTLRVRLDDPPMGEGEANWHEVDVFLDLGGDGVIPMPSRGAGFDAGSFVLPYFPSKFEESLYDGTYTFYAGAYLNKIGDTYEEATFTFHEDVTALDDDAVFILTEQGAIRTRTGISQDVFAMDGQGDGHLWAVGAEGRVLHYDGAWWALQQTPVQGILRDVDATLSTDVWAVGDEGAVLRFNGLVWQPVELPEAIQGVDWHLVARAADGAVWLVGAEGGWRYDGEVFSPLGPSLTDVLGPPLALRGAWMTDDGAAWFVGSGGLIRRVQEGALTPMDVPGEDLNSISGSAPDDLWAVGNRGRILHYNGDVWFDFLPVTHRDLHDVHVIGPNEAWAVGDAGAVLRWDGIRWQAVEEIAHVDLRAVRRSSDGDTLAGGLHTVVLGPILHIPDSVNPYFLTGQLSSLELEWTDTGPEASFTYLQLMEAGGFPFWNLMVDGWRHTVPLPDLTAAWGIPALWPGPGSVQMIRAYMPEFSIDRYDNTMLNQYQWRSWAVTAFPLLVQ